MMLFNKLYIGIFLATSYTYAIYCSSDAYAGTSAFYEFAPYNSSLTKEDLEHGQIQIKNMLKDRTAMSDFLKKMIPSGLGLSGNSPANI